MKRYIILLSILVVIICTAFIFAIVHHYNRYEERMYATLYINQITEKSQADGTYYLTIVLDDYTVEECHLSHNTLKLKTTEAIYSKIDTNLTYIGVSLKIMPYDPADGDIGFMLYTQNTQNWTIIKVFTDKNTSIS